MKKKLPLLLALTATALWLWFIFARSAQPAGASDAESGWVLALVRRLLPGTSMRLIRKLAHFTEYFLLGALLWLDWRLLGREGALPPLGAGLVFAAADELLQTFIPGRSGQVKDVLLDLSGVTLAVALLCLLRSRKIRRKKQKETSERT